MSPFESSLAVVKKSDTLALPYAFFSMEEGVFGTTLTYMFGLSASVTGGATPLSVGGAVNTGNVPLVLPEDASIVWWSTQAAVVLNDDGDLVIDYGASSETILGAYPEGVAVPNYGLTNLLVPQGDGIVVKAQARGAVFDSFIFAPIALLGIRLKG